MKIEFLPPPDKTLFFIGFAKIPVFVRGRILMKRFGKAYATSSVIEEIKKRRPSRIRKRRFLLGFETEVVYRGGIRRV